MIGELRSLPRLSYPLEDQPPRCRLTPALPLGLVVVVADDFQLARLLDEQVIDDHRPFLAQSLADGHQQVGARDEERCQTLWDLVPPDYQQAVVYSDFYASYDKVLGQAGATHRSVGKDSGLTNHVEQWKCTLRQRLGRFVRKTLSFSKSEEMHELMLKLFIHNYNLSLVLYHYLISRVLY